MLTVIVSSPTSHSLLLDLYYAGAITLLKMSLRGAYQCEAVLALRLRLRLRLRFILGLGLDCSHDALT